MWFPFRQGGLRASLGLCCHDKTPAVVAFVHQWDLCLFSADGHHASILVNPARTASCLNIGTVAGWSVQFISNFSWNVQVVFNMFTHWWLANQEIRQLCCCWIRRAALESDLWIVLFIIETELESRLTWTESAISWGNFRKGSIKLFIYLSIYLEVQHDWTSLAVSCARKTTNKCLSSCWDFTKWL